MDKPSLDGVDRDAIEEWVRENVCQHCDHRHPWCEEGPQFEQCVEVTLEDPGQVEEMLEDLGVGDEDSEGDYADAVVASNEER